MRLRTVLLALVLAGFAFSLFWLSRDPAALPSAIMLAVLGLALGIERRFYGTAQAMPPGPGWQATGERFLDDTSGRMVEVWFNPATGERRYQDIGER